MSYDLLVFDPASAPSSQEEFLAWCDLQTEWSESHGYNDPEVPSPALRSWFREFIQTFPPMNGPLASDDDDLRVTDYSLGRSVIYGSFAWSVADEALEKAAALAATHGIGLYAVSSDDGDVWISASDGSLVAMKT